MRIDRNSNEHILKNYTVNDHRNLFADRIISGGQEEVGDVNSVQVCGTSHDVQVDRERKK